MKRLLCLILVLSFALPGLFGCNIVICECDKTMCKCDETFSVETDTTTSIKEETTVLSNTEIDITPETTFTPDPNFSAPPIVKDLTNGAYIGDSFDKDDLLNWSEILANVPSDYYEKYPKCSDAPITAVLYVDGTPTQIDINDPRLIQLVNIYHNSIANIEYAWLQGTYDLEDYTVRINEPTRLELTFSAEQGDGYDKIIVTSTLVENRTPYTRYEFLAVDTYGESAYPDCPVFATGHYPFSLYKTNWLELFGFIN